MGLTLRVPTWRDKEFIVLPLIATQEGWKGAE
jgi:hypothetical protein